MKTFVIVLLSCCTLSAQSFLPTDSLIELNTSWRAFHTVEELPRFPGCDQGRLDGDAKKNCSDRLLLRYIYSQITYPEAAVKAGVEGTVVIRFVIDKEGRLNDLEIARDPGAGCGEEALRVVKRMQNEVTWIPGKHKGETVNVQFNLPVRFQLTDGPGNSGKDQSFEKTAAGEIWNVVDEPAQCDLDLQKFFAENMKYPTRGKYRCESLEISVRLIVHKDGTTAGIEIPNSMGNPQDYVDEAYRLAKLTEKHWQAAKVKNRRVSSYHNLRIPFWCPDYDCTTVNSHYYSGTKLYESRQFEEAKAAFNQCLALNPLDQDALFALGLCEAYLQNPDAACEYWQRMNADYEHEDFGRLRKTCASSEGQVAAAEKEAAVQTPGDIYSCFEETEKEMVMRAKALFLERMKAYYPDSMAHPFQTFLRQYQDVAIDNAFFRLDEPQRKAFRETLPWTTFTEPEDDFEIILPKSEQEAIEKEKQRLAEAQYPEENMQLVIRSPFTTCLYLIPADQEIWFFYERYAILRFLDSRSKANLMPGFLTESHYQQEAVQNMIAVEVFLQRCMNTLE